MARGIDHLVLAVRDLEAARAAYDRLGFMLTPEARHPFGTKNSLVRLDGSFLELLAIADPAAIPQPTKTFFSFAAFNRDFLERREGLSMLALKSRGTEADIADFAGQGLTVYDPVEFERIARAPDGSERKVAFSLAFTSERRLKECGFFTCRHRFPENFWRREYQHHANSARGIQSIVMVARDPADFHEFLSKFAGERDIESDSLGISIDTGEGRIDVVTPVAFRAWFGQALEIEADPKPRFVASRIVVAELGAARDVLRANGVSFEERMSQVVVPAAEAGGSVLAFVNSSFPGPRV